MTDFISFINEFGVNILSEFRNLSRETSLVLCAVMADTMLPGDARILHYRHFPKSHYDKQVPDVTEYFQFACRARGGRFMRFPAFSEV